MGGMAPSDVAPLVADLDPMSPEGDDEVAMQDFRVAPQAHVETGVGADSISQPTSTEPAKDKAVTVVTTMLLDPHQAVLESTPPFSGPMPASLDQSGSFSLAALVERRAKEQFNDVTLLRSSVEYWLCDSEKKIMTLKKELDAAKGWNFPLCFSVSVVFLSFAFRLDEWFSLTGDSTSLAGLKRQLSACVPLTVLNDKLKEREDAHALVVADLQAAADTLEEHRLEVVRLREEVEHLREAEEQRLAEVETLRKNGEDLRVKLKEEVDAHDRTSQAAKEHDFEIEKLVAS